jgi:flagellar basal-body rod protein FlgB
MNIFIDPLCKNIGGDLVLNSLLSSSKAAVLEQALTAASLRQKVISNNIANVNTPGFKRSEVVFEDLLRQAIGSSDKLGLMRTNAKHIPNTLGSVKAQSNPINTTTMRTDGNNVDVDVEMAEMAKNNIYYNAVAQGLSKYYSGLKSVINGGK